MCVILKKNIFFRTDLDLRQKNGHLEISMREQVKHSLATNQGGTYVDLARCGGTTV